MRRTSGLRWCLALAMLCVGARAWAEGNDQCDPLTPEPAECSKSHCTLFDMLALEDHPDARTATCASAEAGSYCTATSSNRDALQVQAWRELSPCRRAALLAGKKPALPPSIRALGIAELEAARERAIAQFGCGGAGFLCLDRDGNPIGSSPDDVEETEVLRAVVLSPIATDTTAVTLSINGLSRTDSLTEGKVDAGAAERASEPITFQSVAEATSPVATADLRAFRVVFSRTGSDGAVVARSSPTIRIQHGRYYFEFGLSVPFVIDGTRTLTSVEHAEIKTEPRAAFSVLLFPWGRNKGDVSHFIFAWSEIRQSLALSLGTDFDFTRSITEKDYHMGLAYEPISGLGVSIGGSLVQGQFVAPGSQVPDELMTGAIPHSGRYMLKGYVGVYFTTEFIHTAQAAISDLRSKKD